jgi:hypothetical protein
MFRRLAVLFSVIVGLLWATPRYDAQSSCTGTLPSRLTVGLVARVTPGDPNNVRDQPSRSGRVVGQIPGNGVFAVLEGPTCADGFAWYRVDYQGEVIGWTVEGTSTTYFTEPIVPSMTATPIPTATPTPTSTPIPPTLTPSRTPTITPIPPTLTPTRIPLLANPFNAARREVVNVLEVGVMARVTDTQRIAVYAQPSASANIIAGLAPRTLLTVTDGAVEADGLRWWQIEGEGGETGWVFEGDSVRAGFRPAIAPLCPAAHVENARVAYVAQDDALGAVNVYTADLAGKSVCNLTYRTAANPPMPLQNQTAFSPDGQRVAFLDGVITDGYPQLSLNALAADGSTTTTLAQGLMPDELVWSPDSSALAMVGILGGQINAQVWAVNADGSGLRTLTERDAFHEAVSWSPDSEMLRYSSVESGDTFESRVSMVSADVGVPTDVVVETDAVFVGVVSPENPERVVVQDVPFDSVRLIDTTTGEVLAERVAAEPSEEITEYIRPVWEANQVWLFETLMGVTVTRLDPETLEERASVTLPMPPCTNALSEVYRVVPEAEAETVLLIGRSCIVRYDLNDEAVEVLFGEGEAGLSAR